MALILSKETPMGVNAVYWKISKVNIYSIGLFEDNPLIIFTVQLTISGYLDESARRADKNPLCELTYIDDENVTIGQNIDLRSTLYTHIKSLPEWAGAIDDLDSPIK